MSPDLERAFAATSPAPERWLSSDLLELTGHADGPPVRGPAAVFDQLQIAADAYVELGGRSLNLDALLTGRASMMGFTRNGQTSCNGSCRLLRCSDGWVAINLSRVEDIGSVDAITATGRGARSSTGDEYWEQLAEWCNSTPVGQALARCHLLGVPAATLGESNRPAVVRTVSHQTPPSNRPVVVDLSAMWAGPLCAQLLRRCGADVTTVESTNRPDGSRSTPEFYEWLHRGHTYQSVDLDSAAGRAAVLALIANADLVIESSRPRALEALGFVAADLVREYELTWISITGHGRQQPHRVAFGDDAGAAGGLVATDPEGLPLFVGDAIADPITGLIAAVAALHALTSGGGLVDVSMAACAAWASTPSADRSPWI